MSTTIDQRVVEMRFDNKQFEAGARTSISTLDKLKQSLNLSGASKGLEDINSAVKGMDFSSVANSISAIEQRFSTMGIVGMTVIQNLTNSAMRLASRLTSWFSSGIVSGGINRAMNLENANFQLQGLLKDADKVEAVMKNVNDAVDGTAYSLDAAASVASQLAASGMEAGDEMYTALRAVAGVAAMTNSEYSDIGSIFTTVAGQGKLMSYQLQQLSFRGMNAAATIGEYLGKTEAQVREMTTNGEIDFKTFAAAMDSAFGEHAKNANKTFNGAMSNVKAALGRIGALFVSPLIVENGPIVTFFNTLRERINEVKNAIVPFATTFTDAVSEIINGVTNLLSKMDFSKPLKVLEGFESDFSDIIEVFDTVNDKNKKTEKSTDSLTDAQKKQFKEMAKLSDEQLKSAGYTEKQIEAFNKLKTSAEKIGMPFDQFIDKLDEINGRWLLIESFKNVGKNIVKVFSTIGEAFGEVFDSVKPENLFDALAALHKFTSQMIISDSTADKLKRTFKGLFSILDIFKKAITAVAKGIGTLFSSGGVSGFTDLLLTLTASIGDFFNTLNNNLSFDGFTHGLSEIASGISEIITKSIGKLDSFGDALSAIGKVTKGMWNALGDVFSWISDNISVSDIFAGLTGGAIYAIFKRFERLIKQISNFIIKQFGLFGDVNGVLTSLKNSLNAFTSSVKVTSLVTIAAAVAILSASLRTLSKLDAGDISKSLLAMGIMFTMLNTSFNSVSKSLQKFASKGLIKAGTSMILIASAIKILANAIVKLSSLSLADLAKGLTVVGIGLAELTFGLKAIDKVNIKTRTSIAMIALAKSCEMLGDALAKFGSMAWREITKGLIGMGGALTEFVIALKALDKFGGIKSVLGSGSLLIAVQSLGKLADGLKKFGELSWKEIKRGLVGMGGALTEVAGAAGALGKIAGFSGIFGSVAIDIVILGLSKLADGLKKFAGMTWSEIVKGLVGMGGALTEVAGISGVLGKIAGFSGIFGSGAILIVVQGLGKLAEAFKQFGGMSWSEIVKGLVGMGGALTEVAGVSGILGKLAGFSGIFGSGAILIVVQGLGKLADSFKKFGGMSWDEIKRGLVGMGGALTEVAIVSGGLGALTNIAGIFGAGAIWVAVQDLGKLADALKKFGEMSWDEIKKGLAAMGSALGELALGGFLNTFAIIGSLSISAMAEDLGVLAESLKKWKDVTVPENLGTDLGFLAAGVMQFNFGGAGSAAIAVLAPALGTLAESVKKWGGVYIRDGLGDNIGTLAAGIRKFSFSGAGALALAASAEAVGTLADSIRKWNGVTIPDGLGDGLKDIADGVAAFTVAFVGGWSIQSLITPLNTLADTVTKWKDVTIPKSLKEDLTSMADGIKAFSWAFVGGWSLETITGPLSDLATSVNNWKNVTIPKDLPSQLETLSGGIKSFTWAFVGGWSLDTIAGPLGDLATSIKQWKGVSIPDDMGDKLKSLAAGIKSFSTVGSISDAVSSTSKIATAAAKLSGVSFTKISSGLNVFSDSLVSFSSSSAAVVGVGDRIVENLITPINSAGPKFSSAGTNLIKALSQGISSGGTNITFTFINLLEQCSTMISGRIDVFVSSGTKLGNALSTGISRGAIKAKSTITQTLVAVSSIINSYYTSFYIAGAYVVTGFCNGISANSYKAAAEARAMAKKAKDAAEDALGINSPSIVFGKIGNFAGLGFINGLSTYVDKAYDAGKNMAMSAKDGLSRAISKINDFINGDMDTQPTIRPVLDLSNIKSGTKEINGMFGSGSSIMANVGSISTMMNSRGQNGVNDDVVSAINKLRKDLGNVGGDTYHVDGITYDDGTNVSDAVRTLIRAAKIERRV